MPEVIISDTSCFIALSRIDGLRLLQQVYGEVITTPDIIEEFGRPLPEWVRIIAPKDNGRLQLLCLQVDRGEASAITLALETPGCTIILDDRKARIIGSRLGLAITGTIGVVIRAKLDGHIPSIKPILDALRSAGFRTSAVIEEESLRAAGEI